MSEDAWLVVVAVAERHGCSTKTVRGYPQLSVVAC